MQTWIWILGGSLAVSLAINAALVALLRHRARAVPARTQPMPRATPGPQQLVSPLIRGRDALGNLVKFMYWQKQGKASSEDGYQVVQMLLDEMYSHWGLEQFGQFGDLTTFDPQIHRSPSNQNPTNSDLVRIIEPGWRLGNQILRYPLVEIRKESR